MSEIPKPVTITELMAATGKSRPTVYRLVASGELPGYRTSRGYIIPRAWFEDWLHGRWQMPEEDVSDADTPRQPEPIDFLKSTKNKKAS